jgi:hypothetical protein
MIDENLKEIACEDVNWIDLVKDWDKQRAIGKRLIDIWFP